MAKTVYMHVSDEAYQCALYLAKLAHKDTTWVMSQWLSYAKDHAIESHSGLREHIRVWHEELLHEYQRSLLTAGDTQADDTADPPY